MDPFTTPANCSIRSYRYYCSSESNTRPDFYIFTNDSVVRRLVFSDSDDEDNSTTTSTLSNEEEEEEEQQEEEKESALENYQFMELSKTQGFLKSE